MNSFQKIIVICSILLLLVGALVFAIRRSLTSAPARAQRIFSEIGAVMSPEELRSWAKPFLQNTNESKISLPSQLESFKEPPIAGVTIGTDVDTGFTFVWIIFKMGVVREGIAIGETNSVLRPGKVRVKWVDGIYYAFDN